MGKKSNDEKYENFCHRRLTDGLTDGAGYIGPALLRGGSKKVVYKIRRS